MSSPDVCRTLTVGPLCVTKDNVSYSLLKSTTWGLLYPYMEMPESIPNSREHLRLLCLQRSLIAIWPTWVAEPENKMLKACTINLRLIKNQRHLWKIIISIPHKKEYFQKMCLTERCHVPNLVNEDYSNIKYKDNYGTNLWTKFDNT